MKKTIQAAIIALCFSTPFLSYSQTNMWTWVNGSNTIDQMGNYGTIGTPAPTNSPGSRDISGTWTDNSGNLWMFGGLGYSTTNSLGLLHDLWKYNTSTNEWTWIKGSTNIDMNGVYSGFIPSNNMPGGRFGSVTWKDNNGNLWLFGGYGYGSFGGSGRLNDLWRYNPTTNSWSFIKGNNTIDQSGVYGTLGVSAFANKPGARDGAIGWTDNSGNLWMFGGKGYDGVAALGTMNDLWKFDIALNEWTWVNGANVVDQVGNYGTQGVSAVTNVPGARQWGVAFNDGNNNLYMFGGEGFTSTMNGFLDDLWKYNITTGEWTWMKGTNGVAQPGTYGTQGVFAAANNPGSRKYLNSWSNNNEFWIYAGNAGAGNIHNDFWKYSVTLNQWMWVGGNNTFNQPASYGTIGVAAASNFPGTKTSHMTWMDNSSNLWMFGGDGYDATLTPGIKNDLWKFVPCVAPASPANVTSATNLSICSNNTTTLNATGTGTVSWYSVPTGGSAIIIGTNYATPSLTAGTTATTYIYYAEDLTCSPSVTRTAITVTVNPLPNVNITSPSSVICLGQSATLTASGASTYTWSNTSNASTLVISNPPSTTTVTVTGTGTNSCQKSAVYTLSVSACTGLNEESATLENTQIYPNPFSSKLILISQEGNKEVKIYNALGAVVYFVKISSDKTELDLSNQPSGIYFVTVKAENHIKTIKVVKD